MYQIVLVDDTPNDIDARQLKEWVMAALVKQGIAKSVSCQSFRVLQDDLSWEQALNVIIKEKPSVVFVDDHMPTSNAGIRFIRSLRTQGYSGYTYIHTGVDAPKSLQELVSLEPRLLKGHGSGAVRKGRKDDVVDILSSHLQQAGEKGLPFFQVSNPDAFLEPSPLDRALDLLSELYTFQVFWETVEQPSSSRETVFEEFISWLPEKEHSTSVESWLTARSGLVKEVQEDLMRARTIDEWQKALERLRDALLLTIH